MSSSSSDDEDLSRFASCAVSADQIEQTALAEARKRTSSQSARRPAAAAAAVTPGDAGTAAVRHAGAASCEPALDLVSAKVRLEMMV